MNSREFIVSRQHYYYSKECVVEIAQGGRDYSGPDMLVPKYRGEGDVFVGMIAAVNAAIEIAKTWKEDEPKVVVKIAHGCNHGMGMEFSDPDQCGCVTNKSWLAKLKRIAKEFDEKLPKCASCSQILGAETWSNDEICPDVTFCSEHCFDKAAAFYYEQMEELDKQEA